MHPCHSEEFVAPCSILSTRAWYAVSMRFRPNNLAPLLRTACSGRTRWAWRLQAAWTASPL